MAQREGGELTMLDRLRSQFVPPGFERDKGGADKKLDFEGL